MNAPDPHPYAALADALEAAAAAARLAAGGTDPGAAEPRAASSDRYNRAEAAEYLGMSRSALSEIMSAGGIDYMRVTPGKRGRVYFTRQQLDDYRVRATVRAASARRPRTPVAS